MSRMRVGEVLQAVNRLAPFDTALDWDNSGLLVGDRGAEVEKVLVALDVTAQVVAEAKAAGAGLIVSHHPVIFGGGRKRLLAGDPAFEAAAAGIAVISAHTNYDMAPEGVNHALAQALELQNVRPLVKERTEPWKKLVVFVPATHAEAVYRAMSEAGAGKMGNYGGVASILDAEGRFLPLPGSQPFIGRVGEPCRVVEKGIEMVVPPHLLEDVLLAVKQAHPYEEPAWDVYDDWGVTQDCWLGCVGSLTEAVDEAAFARRIREALGIAPRFNPGKRSIRRVAVCGGAGADALSAAPGIDALVTGDVKHHQFLEAAARGITLYDAGHYATENIAMPQLRDQLRRLLPGVTVDLARAYAGQVASL